MSSSRSCNSLVCLVIRSSNPRMTMARASLSCTSDDESVSSFLFMLGPFTHRFTPSPPGRSSATHHVHNEPQADAESGLRESIVPDSAHLINGDPTCPHLEVFC